jgi:hypothetical protein
MDLKNVLEQLQAERDRVSQAIAALENLQGVSSAPRRGRPPKNPKQYASVVAMPKKRTMSPAARRRISEMMKKRWAERKRKSRAA